MTRKISLIGSALLAMVLAGPADARVRTAEQNATVRVRTAELPLFEDDLSLAGLTLSLERQRANTEHERAVVLGGVQYSGQHIQASLDRFAELVEETRGCLTDAADAARRSACWKRFRRVLENEFVVYTTRTRAHLTAYYTPTIDVSPTPDASFRFPIYRLPDLAQLRHLSRYDIDFRGALAGHGLELFYARSRFDIYILQVEGGGRVRIRAERDPRIAYLIYAGDNGRPVRLLEHSLLHQGILRPDDLSRAAQRKLIEHNNPEAERALANDPSYVYFKVSDGPVIGSSGAILTPDRSLASDPAYYPTGGLLAFVRATVPVLPNGPVSPESNPDGLRYRPMSRFFLNQDEGSYIKGGARFDLFFGEGRYAEFLANNFDARGRVYFLVLKRTGDRK